MTHDENMLNDLYEKSLQAMLDKTDRLFANAASQVRCELEVARTNGNSDAEPCGKEAHGVCGACGTVICHSHALILDRALLCIGCSALQPTKQEMLDLIELCADVVSPKHYPGLVRDLEAILKRAGRPI